MISKKFFQLSLGFCLLFASACGTQQDTIEDVKSGLNSDLGGYTLDQELPLFGRTDLDEFPIKPSFRLPEIPRFGFNVMVPPADNPVGVMVGFWTDMEKGTGVWAGKWADQSGRIIGHLKGVYGYSSKYKTHVFFAKLIDLGGNAKGVINGRFKEGKFRGSWVDDKRQILGLIEGYSTPNNSFRARWHAMKKPNHEPNPGENPWRFLN
jgi:hypothetical protein